MICNFKIPYYSEVGKYVKIFYNWGWFKWLL
jgi:hypothetical protein